MVCVVAVLALPITLKLTVDPLNMLLMLKLLFTGIERLELAVAGIGKGPISTGVAPVAATAIFT